MLNQLKLILFILGAAAWAQTPEVEPPKDVAPIPKAEAVTPAPLDNPPPAPNSGYTDPASGKSEPRFDWSQHKGETEVPHPLAEKGLVEITKDKTYIYNVNESGQTKAASVKIGLFNPTNLRNPDAPAGSSAVTFADNYNESNSPAILAEYEWQIWRIGVGKIGITAGSGVFVAQGHGHFVHPDENPGLSPKETFTFAAFPTSVGAIYRLHIWDRQLFVPYGTGGVTLIPFSEIRDDNTGPKFGASAAAYVAAGVGLNLTYFDKFSALSLDREYGINRMYLTGEFREMIALDTRYNFGGNFLNFGFTAEF